MFDPVRIKSEFPIFKTKTPKGKDLVYLDNAATTQKPQSVIDGISTFYSAFNSNIHRGAYWPASQASGTYENSRSRIASFINAEPANVIFTSGTTDGVNRVARSFLEPEIKEGDEVVVTMMEHHSNFVPWQQVCKRKGAILKVCPLNEDLTLNVEKLKELITDHTEMVAISSISNTLGVINDLKEVIDIAHKYNAWVLVDAAQSVAHAKTDVLDLDCDFMVFSGHKLYGPTGIGVLYGKKQALDLMQPYPMGGGGIKDVSIEETIFSDPPAKFEAGTPNIAGAIGLANAIEFISQFEMEQIKSHTQSLAIELRERLNSIPQVTCYGNYSKSNSGPVLSFNVDNIHPHDIAGFLSEEGIAIRAGHHCTQPLMDSLGVPGTCRVSFGIYNEKEEIDLLIDTLNRTIKFFS